MVTPNKFLIAQALDSFTPNLRRKTLSNDSPILPSALIASQTDSLTPIVLIAKIYTTNKLCGSCILGLLS
jgi:hypothetical protein